MLDAHTFENRVGLLVGLYQVLSVVGNSAVQDSTVTESCQWQALAAVPGRLELGSGVPAPKPESEGTEFVVNTYMRT